MDEELTTTPVSTETPEIPAPEAQAAPDWKEIIEKVPAHELRRHSRIAGIVGSELQSRRKFERDTGQEFDDGLDVEAEKEVARLKKLDMYSPELEQRVKTGRERAAQNAEQFRRQQQEAEEATETGRYRIQHAERVGEAIAMAPEWSDGSIGDDDKAKMVQQLIGVPDEHAVMVFQKLATDAITKARAKKAMEYWKGQELAKEREVLKQELAAQYLQNTEAPDTTKPKGLPAKFNPASLEGKDFDDWWERGKN